MDATKIYQLAWYIEPSAWSNRKSSPSVPYNTDMNMEELLHYLDCYKDLQFGWRFVSYLAEHKQHMPPILATSDLWLWRAYVYLLTGKKDHAIETALQLTCNTMDNTRSAINAVLVNPQATIEDTAQKFSIPVNSLQAYEKLFFNILDRREDSKFIADVVYPNTRMVEFFSDYAQREALEQLLMRAGYNYNPDDVAYLAGIGPTNLLSMSPSDLAEKAELYMFCNGIMMAQGGFLNQSQDAMGIRHIRQLMQSEKQGGNDSGGESPFVSASNVLGHMTNMQKELTQSAMQRAELLGQSNEDGEFQMV